MNLWPVIYIISLVVLMFSCGAIGWFLRMRQELKQLAIAEEAMADYYAFETQWRDEAAIQVEPMIDGEYLREGI